MSLSGNGLAPPIMNYKSLFCLSKVCIAFGAVKVEGRKSILMKGIWFCLTGSNGGYRNFFQGVLQQA